MAKYINPKDFGRPKTLTLRLDAKVAKELDKLISTSPESTYSSLIVSLILERWQLNYDLLNARETSNERFLELQALQLEIAQLKSSLEFILEKLNRFKTVGARDSGRS